MTGMTSIWFCQINRDLHDRWSSPSYTLFCACRKKDCWILSDILNVVYIRGTHDRFELVQPTPSARVPASLHQVFIKLLPRTSLPVAAKAETGTICTK